MKMWMREVADENVDARKSQMNLGCEKVAADK
jgi:hypothetical protein